MNRAKLIANLPNLISVARLLLAPLTIGAILSGRFGPAFAVFVAAGLSDALDGAIAKRFQLTSKLGAYLDPLADKALLTSIYLTLAATGHMPVWLAILVVTRDVMILAAIPVSWMLNNPVEIRPVSLSKFNTAFQIAYAAFVLWALAFGVHAPFLSEALVWLVAVSTAASGAVYIAIWLDHMSH